MDPINVRLSRTSNAATPVNMDTDIVLPGSYWKVMGVSAWNNSAEAVSFALAIVTGAELDYVWAHLNVPAAQAVGILVYWIVAEGQKIRAVCTGTTLTGPIGLLVFGEHRELCEDAPDEIEQLPAQAASGN